jgi:alanine racemase
MPESLPKIIPELAKLKNIKIEGVYSHFANIEDTADFSHAQKQIDIYTEVIKLFENNGFRNLKKHISATSGVLAWEGKSLSDMDTSIVRIGIGTYGVELEQKCLPAKATLQALRAGKNKIELKPVLRWVTHIAQIKTLPAGHSIGYGLSYITKKPTTIAVIPQGYADGLTRSLSNKGEVLIGGKRAPILGRVAMNMFVVDVSYIPGVQSEDEVVILGKQGLPELRSKAGKNQITAEEIAEKMGTINYEVTTHISALLPRIIG